ncbi:MAG: hypothetical protein U1D67_08030 [Dehalococcoidia bacterium]|nr:hypothetical protein [Dehalococcoidia bacterium]MDZ4247052.1 hypothetical protein [Dehalococcoidia bacterium]
METFHGTVHLPGTDKPMDIQLDVDWIKKRVELLIPDRPGGVEEWEGILVQDIDNQELLFRTKGLPGSLAHWWHLYRSRHGGLFGMIIALPDHEGRWPQCTMTLDKGELVTS